MRYPFIYRKKGSVEPLFDWDIFDLVSVQSQKHPVNFLVSSFQPLLPLSLNWV